MIPRCQDLIKTIFNGSVVENLKFESNDTIDNSVLYNS